MVRVQALPPTASTTVLCGIGLLHPTFRCLGQNFIFFYFQLVAFIFLKIIRIKRSNTLSKSVRQRIGMCIDKSRDQWLGSNPIALEIERNNIELLMFNSQE
ncbi:hypothetical protein Dd703_1553 [Musicola paradisiaca Ech703]|uniref:Uncharacterized protein n=1 Tax=Musicola paradisiaca (strain Ech703) TaxID=579405 RepID=C6C3K7_MUSP7|nr:hypothetical protein Dd703_1553 [Musicola paradisiaca Ech703]